jgi:hypothetical protein
VEGEAYIWRASGSGSSNANNTNGGGPAASTAPAVNVSSSLPKAQGSRVGEEGAAAEEPHRTKLASALEKAAADDADPASLDGSEGKQDDTASALAPGAGTEAAREERQQAAVATAASAEGGDAAGQQGAAGAAAEGGGRDTTVERPQHHLLEEFIKPLEHLGEQVSEMLHTVTHPKPQQPDGGGTDRGSNGGSDGGSDGGSKQQAGESVDRPVGGPLLGLSSQSITSAIQDSVAMLQQVRQSVERLTGNVQDGSLQRLSQQLADSRGTQPRRRPYSLLLAQVRMSRMGWWCMVVCVGGTWRDGVRRTRAVCLPAHCARRPVLSPAIACCRGSRAG